MKLISAFLLAVPIVFAADANPWLRKHTVPLRSAEPGQGFTDMQPLKKIVGDARIVSLGEATHGSREFFQLKHRMLEFLATEMGFTIFSIEANMPEAYLLNEYVLTGKGDPAQLLKGMYFWTWDTEEVLAMIKWMRAFNASGKGRVEFTGFDMQTPTVAMKNATDFIAQRDPAFAPKLKAASALVGSSGQSGRQNFGVVTFNAPAQELAGKKVRYSGFIRTADVEQGQAQLWFRADRQGAVKAFRNLSMAGAGGTGTMDWKEYSIELEVPADADQIVFGGTFDGTGTAWFDGFRLQVEGKPHTLANLDFEGPLQQGYYTGGPNTSIKNDTTIFHDGKQSVRLVRSKLTTEPDVQQAVTAWKQVVQHMEEQRPAYRDAGSKVAEIEWAIQNARVVRQCLEMRAGTVSRDESMARNVEWILEQSPKAKIVLWAHNGHVATSGFRGYTPMGAALRKTYGGDMVVFGFAFEQGSFQAVKPGVGLQDHTVPAAPVDTWDALMATAGQDIFALDLRGAPAEFRHPMKSRNVGALYAHDPAKPYYSFSEAVVPEIYDALLFVKSTTAARKNLSPSIFAKTGDGEWRDAEKRVQFKLGEEWSINQAFRWGTGETGETTVVFTDAKAKSTRAALYYRVLNEATVRTPEQAEKSLIAGLDHKVAQRRREGLPDYTEKPDSRRRHEVDGHPAISWVADFTASGEAMVEVCTYIQSERVTALFFTKLPAAGLKDFEERFAPTVASLRIP